LFNNILIDHMTDEELIAINQALIAQFQEGIVSEQLTQDALNTSIAQAQAQIIESNDRIDNYELEIQCINETMIKAGLITAQ
jgi:hypothetical protein